MKETVAGTKKSLKKKKRKIRESNVTKKERYLFESDLHGIALSILVPS